jgi:hypothetical protein
MTALSAGALGSGGPAETPPVVGDARARLAAELLSGSGIEIGALHLPLAFLTRVDVVDDGELLSTIPAESVDFIIANHFLEHCEDPIRTIGTHLGKLRADGVLF